MPWLLLAQPYDAAIAGTRSLYFSDVGFTTQPSDTPANVYWNRRIETPLTLQMSLYAGGDAAGRSDISVGEITLANDDGKLDVLANYDWDGRFIEVRYTAKEKPILSDFGVVFAGTAEQIVLGDLITVEVRDLQILFDEPYQPNRFAGTGGAEGPAEFKDRRKPRLMGVRRQFVPVLLDQASWTFCYNDGPVGGPLEVRDAGVILTSAGDFASYAALTAASIPAGQYGSCNALGLVRTGVAPTGVLTMDAEGAKPSGTVLKKFGEMAVHIVDVATPLGSSDFDAGALTAINTLCPQPLGFWYDGGSEITVRAVLDKLAESPGIFYGFDDARKIVMGRLDAPAVTAAFTFRERDLLSLTPRRIERRLKTQVVRYAQRERPLGDQEIAGAVTGAARTALIEEWRQEKHASAAVAAESLLAREETLDSCFDQSADALAEAQRRVALHGPKRFGFDVETPFIAGVRPGMTVEIRDSRFGLSGGRKMRVMSVTRRAADGILAMELWG